MKNQLVRTKLNIGILFNFAPSWLGGILYIINTINTLNYLEDYEKPRIYLFYRSNLKRFLKEIEYPDIYMIETSFPSFTVGYIKSWLGRKNIFVNDIINKYPLDVIYPLIDYPVKNKTKVKLIAFYADLQHKYYPEFFTKKKILERYARIRFMLRNSQVLIVSSQDVKDDFVKFYKLRNDLTVYIYHFVSLIKINGSMNFDRLRIKYNLPEKYYMISNQFHKHKNHKIVLVARATLNKKGDKKYLAITGKLPNNTRSLYLSEFRQLIKDHHLEDQIRMLGVIPREDQIQIMKHSIAVLQPSLFEGWSTVIEDAISLQVPVIASKIPVHYEQLGENGIYFDPYNPNELADVLCNYPRNKLGEPLYEDSSKRIKDAANCLIQIFREATKSN